MAKSTPNGLNATCSLLLEELRKLDISVRQNERFVCGMNTFVFEFLITQPPGLVFRGD